MNRVAESRSRGFTLVELLVSISIITLLASMILVALAGVQANAKSDRTRAQIARIDTLISEKWDTYRERRLPVTFATTQMMAQGPPAARANAARNLATIRLNLLRELMRLELPDRKADVLAPPNVARSLNTNYVNSLQRMYRRKAAKLIAQRTGATFPADESSLITWLDSQWSRPYDYAECLYLILSLMNDGDKPALSFFSDQEIGDFDSDGMPEIHDSWGQPIMFLRWAPGYTVVGGPQVRPGIDEPAQPDPLDLYRVSGKTFALYPLIASAGPDNAFDIATDTQDGNAVVYAAMTPPNNPYVGWDPNDPLDTADGVKMIGSYLDGNEDFRDNSLDNITSHNLIAN